MFDVERLKTIDADLAGAQQGDRDAQLRLMNFHVPLLLVFARTVNDRIEQGFYAGKADPVVGEPEEQPTSEVENENVENASEDAEEGSKNVEGGSEDAPETSEEEVEFEQAATITTETGSLSMADMSPTAGDIVLADQDDSVGEPDPSEEDLVRSRLRQQGSLIDDLEEDSVAAPGSPTALAEDAAIAAAKENEDADEGGNMTPETGEDLRTPSDDPSEN